MGLRDRTKLRSYNCFFVTTTCHNWHNLLVYEESVSLLYNSLLFVNEKYNTSIVAFVIMPNHIHLILYFNQENYLPEYMRDFKKYTSVKIRQIIEAKEGEEGLEKLKFQHRDQRFKVWMDRFDDAYIRNTKMLLTKLKYIHRNPVGKGLVNIAADYANSSAAFYDRGLEGRLPILAFTEII